MAQRQAAEAAERAAEALKAAEHAAQIEAARQAEVEALAQRQAAEALKAAERAEAIQKRREAVQGLLRTPKRLWEALRSKPTPQKAKPAPKADKEPEQEAAKTYEVTDTGRDRWRQEREAERRQLLAEADKTRQLTSQMSWRIAPLAEDEWKKAQADHPDDHAEAVKAVRRLARREVNALVGARVWNDAITREFERIITATTKEASTSKGSAKPQKPEPSIPQPDPTSQPELRHKRGGNFTP